MLQRGVMDRYMYILSVTMLAIGIILYKNSSLQTKSAVTSQRLVIGVISARDHFQEREKIRHTWGTLARQLPNVTLVFVLGDRDCNIHPAYRISPYECHRWQILEEDIRPHKKPTFFNSQFLSSSNTWNNRDCDTGLSFRVLHPVVLEAFTLRADVIKRLKTCRLLLQDAEEVIESVVVTKDNCSMESNQCIIKIGAPLYLPTGFEGELRIDKNVNENENLCGEDLFNAHQKEKWECNWRNSSVVEFRLVRTRKDVTTTWSRTSCPLVSAKYHVADLDALKRHRNQEEAKRKEWEDYCEGVKRKVKTEMEKYPDLLMIPHLDVYSNLPGKILGFLKWVSDSYNSSFVMKVDDDTFVNMPLLDRIIKTDLGKALIWWSQFHHHRIVPTFGKWADGKYPSLTYPAFPAGAGYVLSGSLAKVVASVGSQLTSSGGEDVSMGIWVASVANDVTYVDEPCWLPDRRCQQSVLVPQVSLPEMVSYWKDAMASKL